MSSLTVTAPDLIFAILADAVAGKIAICSRGTNSFSAKAVAAVAHGAIATIVYNNEPGVINMDLSDYQYTAPCVSITQEDGALIRAASLLRPPPAVRGITLEQSQSAARLPALHPIWNTTQ